MSGAGGSSGSIPVEGDPTKAPSKFAMLNFKELRQLCTLRGLQPGRSPTSAYLRELLDQSEALKTSNPDPTGEGEEALPSEDDTTNIPDPDVQIVDQNTDEEQQEDEDEEEIESSGSDRGGNSPVPVRRLSQANLGSLGTEGGFNPFRPPGGPNQGARRGRNLSGDSNQSQASKGSQGHSKRRLTTPQRREHEAKMREAELRIKKQELEVALVQAKLDRARQPRESGLVPTGGSNIPKDKDRSFDHRNLSKIVPPYKAGDDIHKWITALERACKVQQVPQEQWAAILWLSFEGRGRDRLLTVSDEDARNYLVLKSVLIEGLGLTTEQYRLMFRETQKTQTQDWSEFVECATKALEGWLLGSKVTDSGYVIFF